MKLTFTLQAAYTGATYVAGPFNISGKTSDNVTHELATGVTKTALVGGYDVDTVLETLTGGTITSTGLCGTVQPWYVLTPPDPGNANSAIPVATGGGGSSGTACQSGTTLQFNSMVYHPSDTTLVDGHQYFGHTGAVFNGDGAYFCDGTVVGQISVYGIFVQQTYCSGV